MTITYHTDLDQGSEEWLSARRGLITASEMKLILTPTLKVAANEKTRAHAYELAAQRITGYTEPTYTEPTYIGDAMLRGIDDEYTARELYRARVMPVEEVGFVTNDEWGFTIGYSPDGLVGKDGLIEIKSRAARFQIETITTGVVPIEHVLQLQTGLLVTGRQWIDYISYSGGLPMCIIRVQADPVMQDAIVAAASVFEATVAGVVRTYRIEVAAMSPLIETKRLNDAGFL